MSVLRNVLESLPQSNLLLETFDRTGTLIASVDGREFLDLLRAFRRSWTPDPADSRADGRQVVAMLFKSDETIEFLVAAFAAMSRGYTVVPLYPSWSSETQLEYLDAYRLRTLCIGKGFRSRIEEWTLAGRVDPGSVSIVDLEGLRAAASAVSPADRGRGFDFDVPEDHACAWIFTSGTSGKLAKLTEISRRNLEAAVEAIQGLDFLYPGMTIHSPLSASHIFAFVCIVGFLAIKPRRVIFSDVQYLARLPQSKTGKIDGLILVPIVMNRLRAGFYERLTSKLDRRTAPEELQRLARMPLAARKLLKRVVLRAEQAVIDRESTGSINPAGWAAIQLARRLFGRLMAERLGSPEFVVVGGAKPNLQAMAFLEVMGVRCLQGWGMTETTGPLAVCRLGDRFSGAFGTCGKLFASTSARILPDGELVVEGPQIANGYHQPDGSFVPFNGCKHTGDHAEFDSSGRLKVLGKASDRITTENGINYNPIPFEEELHALDLNGRHLLEEIVVIGDAQPRLGVVFFAREGVAHDSTLRAYAESLVRAFNGNHAVDEKIGPWVLSGLPFKETGLLGPSGKLVRRRVEERFAALFESAYALAP